jgi:hypothetical protein
VWLTYEAFQQQKWDVQTAGINTRYIATNQTANLSAVTWHIARLPQFNKCFFGLIFP